MSQRQLLVVQWLLGLDLLLRLTVQIRLALASCQKDGEWVGGVRWDLTHPLHLLHVKKAQ